MEKATETRDPKVSAEIRKMKAEIKSLAAEQRLLKSLRKTDHNVHPDREKLLKERFGISTWRLPIAIRTGRNYLTALHIAYGELRVKPHAVVCLSEYENSLCHVGKKYEMPKLMQILVWRGSDRGLQAATSST